MPSDVQAGLALEMRELTKHYPVPRQKTKRVAVDKLNLDVPVGTIFGFLGPNGAGKTTTIKVLLGFTAATAGSAWIFGKISSDDSARSAIGYVPEQPYFHKFLTAQEIVRCHGALAGFGGSDLNRRAAASLETVEMAEHALTPLSKLSKGMTQRIALASALVGDPKLLILDEPSSGLDPLGRKFLRDLLLRLRDEGKTIFLSSHLLSEMEEVCDHVGILARGKLVAAGKPSEIVEARDAVAVDIETPERDEVLANTVAEWGGQLESGDSGAPRRVLVPSAKVYSLIELLEKRRARLVAVVPQRESLEDAFVRLVS